MLDLLPLRPKRRKEIEEGKYHRWRHSTKTAKVYLTTLFALVDGECPSCGCDMILSFNEMENQRPNSATLDHITPMSKVLEHNKYGLQIMCKQCNAGKGDR